MDRSWIYPFETEPQVVDRTTQWTCQQRWRWTSASPSIGSRRTSRRTPTMTTIAQARSSRQCGRFRRNNHNHPQQPAPSSTSDQPAAPPAGGVTDTPSAPVTPAKRPRGRPKGSGKKQRLEAELAANPDAAAAAAVAAAVVGTQQQHPDVKVRRPVGRPRKGWTACGGRCCRRGRSGRWAGQGRAPLPRWGRCWGTGRRRAAFFI